MLQKPTLALMYVGMLQLQIVRCTMLSMFLSIRAASCEPLTT